jgi:metallophosphoesterase (TIGR00282 family)
MPTHQQGGPTLIVLFFGDIVGEEANAYLAERLPELRDRYRADLVIANAENCAPNGLGMSAKQVELLFASGVDVVTGGNHSWDSPESIGLLDHPRVVRPFNVGTTVPGRGALHLTVAGEEVTVVNLADACAMRSVAAVTGLFEPAYHGGWVKADKRGTVIVDYHGDHVLEKKIFARAVDGEAAAVFGTHTHEPTLPLYILPGGTAFVTDVGMVGPTGGVQGFAYDTFVVGLKTLGNPMALTLPFPLPGPITIGGVVCELVNGRAVSLERIA